MDGLHRVEEAYLKQKDTLVSAAADKDTLKTLDAAHCYLVLAKCQELNTEIEDFPVPEDWPWGEFTWSPSPNPDKNIVTAMTLLVRCLDNKTPYQKPPTVAPDLLRSLESSIRIGEAQKESYVADQDFARASYIRDCTQMIRNLVKRVF